MDILIDDQLSDQVRIKCEKLIRGELTPPTDMDAAIALGVPLDLKKIRDDLGDTKYKKFLAKYGDKIEGKAPGHIDALKSLGVKRDG